MFSTKPFSNTHHGVCVGPRVCFLEQHTVVLRLLRQSRLERGERTGVLWRSDNHGRGARGAVVVTVLLMTMTVLLMVAGRRNEQRHLYGNAVGIERCTATPACETGSMKQVDVPW